jgi:hypothetical protein
MSITSYSKTTNFSKLRPNLVREKLHQMLCKLPDEDYTLFHLTTTYLPYQDRTYTEKDLNKFFINFYLKSLLPDIFHTRSWSKSKKLQQPIVLSFLDEHESKPVVIRYAMNNQPVHAYPIRLHHHSIIASRESTTEFFTNSIGDNTFCKYASKFMTTNLVQSDADRVFYASKMLWKYPNYQMFGFQ